MVSVGEGVNVGVDVSVGGSEVWVKVIDGIGVEVCCDRPKQLVNVSNSNAQIFISFSMR